MDFSVSLFGHILNGHYGHLEKLNIFTKLLLARFFSSKRIIYEILLRRVLLVIKMRFTICQWYHILSHRWTSILQIYFFLCIIRELFYCRHLHVFTCELLPVAKRSFTVWDHWSDQYINYYNFSFGFGSYAEEVHRWSINRFLILKCGVIVHNVHRLHVAQPHWNEISRQN